MFMKRLSALAEILLVLALGNLIGEALYSLIEPASVGNGTASAPLLAAYSGLLIFMRLGLAGGFGLLLLYLRRGITPRQAGLTRNNHSTASLVGQGCVLGLVSSFLVSVLFALHALIPLGEGLPAWWTYSDSPIDLTFLISLLGTSILIPPLTEEIMARGYFRVRLVESYGVMSGVILAALVFGLSHTRYLQADGMLLLFMAVILINTITWTYLAQKTGSIIAPRVAHSLSNGIASAILFNVWIPFLLVTIGVIVFARPIRKTAGQFFQDWRNDAERGSLWQGLAIVIGILVIALLGLSQIGRTSTLVALGGFCLLVTVANVVAEKLEVRRLEMQN
jgi:membrane protease YdiL (CAAX protease family)